jgi:hypothetical protein
MMKVSLCIYLENLWQGYLSESVIVTLDRVVAAYAGLSMALEQ